MSFVIEGLADQPARTDLTSAAFERAYDKHMLFLRGKRSGHRMCLKDVNLPSLSNLINPAVIVLSRATFVNVDFADNPYSRLTNVNFDDASFEYCRFRYLQTSDCNFNRTSICDSDFIGAQLGCASFHNADITDSDFKLASFAGATLQGATLEGCNLESIVATPKFLRSFGDVNLINCKNVPDLMRSRITHIPPTGSFTAWKKLHGNVIAKLFIPAKAKRSHALSSRKCRASAAKVIEMYRLSGPEGRYTETPVLTGKSLYNSTFEYRVGETVKPRLPYHDNPDIECASGIHFYLTKEEAVAH